MVSTRRNTIQKVLDKYVSKRKNTDCWIWTGAIGKQTGYGVTTDNYVCKSAHTYVYESLVAKVPKGLELDHLCRVRQCVNPAHLEPVTRKENARRGLVTKLTMTQVSKIRGLYAEGKRQCDIAILFNIDPSHVSKIISNQRWT